MIKRVLTLLNIKPAEAGLVKQLFIIQFLLGIATSFLYISSLTLFLSQYPINVLPQVFIIAAILILIFNKIYAHFEHKLSATRLLQVIVTFALISTLLFWVFVTVFAIPSLVLILAAWTTLIYMLVGYAFWGLAALLFNVRESKRIFSIVGAGDIPAKMIGYLAASVLVQVLGVKNLLWISIGSLAICFMYVRLARQRISFHHTEEHGVSHTTHKKPDLSFSTVVTRLFTSKLVFYISLLSFVSYIIFSFVDFTFLLEIKVKYKKDYELASFIATFFAIGRFFAIFIKLLVTSRAINRLGLVNSLLITPVLLLVINCFILYSGGFENSRLYLFGSMVLLMEVLRSIIQEPVFFILFQPLSPHDRLKGHLIAKGYTFPIALLGVGVFLVIYLRFHSSISIFYTTTVLTIFILIWMGVVFLVKREYMQTLVRSLRRGFFTGGDLFINDESVFKILIRKLKSNKPLEVINALNLLERSGYSSIATLLLEHVRPEYPPMVREYAIGRIISTGQLDALPLIKTLISDNDSLSPVLFKALFALEPFNKQHCEEVIPGLYDEAKKSSLIGLLLRKDKEADQFVLHELLRMVHAGNEEELMMVNEVLASADGTGFEKVLEKLLEHSSPAIFRPAMEITGRLWAFDLFPKLLEVAARTHSHHSLQMAIVNFGDEIFDEKHLSKNKLTERLHQQLIRASSKVKGQRSDNYLFSLFSAGDHRQDSIVYSLWQKKAEVSGNVQLLEKWITNKLEDMHMKVECFLSIRNNHPAHLLEEALISEIQQNVESLLQAFAMLYDRQQIDRFMEIYKMDNAAKLANAIELLELTIPKKYFNQIISYIELKYDVKKKQVFLQSKLQGGVEMVIGEVVVSRKVPFNSWSRSIALYLSPQLISKNLAKQVAAQPVNESDELVKETRNYVLSILK